MKETVENHCDSDIYIISIAYIQDVIRTSSIDKGVRDKITHGGADCDIWMTGDDKLAVHDNHPEQLKEASNEQRKEHCNHNLPSAEDTVLSLRTQVRRS